MEESTKYINRGFVLSVLLLVLVLFVSWFVLDKVMAQVRSESRDKLELVRDLLHDSVRIWANERLTQVEQVAGRDDVQTLVKELLALPRQPEAIIGSPPLQKLRAILRPQIDRFHYQGFLVIARDRISIASMRDENTGVQNLLVANHRQYLERLFAGESQLIPPLRSDVPLPDLAGVLTPNSPTMFIGVPVFDQDQSVLAVLTFRLDPAHDFSRIVGMARIGSSGDSYAFDLQGRLLTEARFIPQLRKIGILGQFEKAGLALTLRDPGGNLFEGFRPAVRRDELPLTRMAQSAVLGERGVDLDGYRDYRGVPVVGAWLWDDVLHFGLAFEIDQDEAYQAFFIIRRLLLLFWGALFVMFGVVVSQLIHRRRQAEAVSRNLLYEVEQRKESENKLRGVFESSPDGMMIVNRAGEITMVNKQIEQLFGYRLEELKGQLVETLIPERFVDIHRHHREGYFVVPNVRAMGHSMELFGCRKDGVEVPLEVSLSPVASDEGGGVVVSIRDISERKAAEEKIRRITAGLAEAQRIACLGNWEWDVVNKTIYWSHEMELICGSVFSQPHEVGLDELVAFVYPQDRQEVREAIGKALSGEKEINLVHRFVNLDGEEGYAQLRGEVVRDTDGRPLKVYGTLQDFSQRIKAEEELRIYRDQLEMLVNERTLELAESEEKLRHITSSAQSAIIMISDLGLISFWNAAAEKIFGWSADEMLGRNLHQHIMPERFHEAQRQAFAHFLETGSGKCIGHVMEMSAIRKGGDEFPVELMVSAVKVKGKWHAIGMVNDISERKQVEQTLRDHMEELERFSRMAVGREMKVIELKKEVNELLAQLGRGQKYKIVS